jgi:outer membrane protein, multidrug efflux system
MRWVIVMLVGLVLVVGCAQRVPVREPGEVGIEVPEEWRALSGESDVYGVEQRGSSTRGEAGWVGTLADEPLASLVSEALEHNRDLQVAATRLRAAAALARIEGAAVYPTVGIGGEARRSSNRFEGPAGQTVHQYETRYSAALDVSWEVDLWSRLSARRQAAAGEARAAAHDVAAARLSIAGNIARLWLGLVETQQQLDLAEASVQTYRQTVRLVRDRFEQGLRTSLDVRLAETELALAEALAEQRRGERDRLTRQLELLLGRYPAGELEAARELPELPAPVPAGVPAEVLLRRPDVRASYVRLISADRRLYAARMDLLPRLSLTAGGGIGSGELRDILRPDHIFWNLAANVAQPIYRGGELRARVDLQDAQVAEQWSAYSRAALTAFTEVEQALAAETHLRQQQVHLLAAREQAEGAERVADEQYREGLIEILSLLQAQQRTLDARGRTLQNTRLILENRINLHLALGGEI